MTAPLFKALVVLVPASVLLFGSIVLFRRTRAIAATLQVLGAAGLVGVALAHICEATQTFPAMHWGMEHSVGHYLDLSGALLGLLLFPIGYLIHALTVRGSSPTRKMR